MRAWILGGVLVALTASGGYCVYFVGSCYESAGQRGPCVNASVVVESPVEPVTLCGSDAGCTMPPVTDVFEVAKALEQPPPVKGLPFISFDEPPFAKPTNTGIVQATFVEAIATEIAPMPRERDDTTPGVERLPAPRVYRAF